MSSLLPILALVATAAAPPPDPNDLQYTARSTLVTADDPSLLIYAAPLNSSYYGVAKLLITKPAGTFLCTGSLYGTERSNVVTAAHCLVGATSVVATFWPAAGGAIVKTTTSYAIKSGYTGDVIDPNDIAVIDLGSPVAGIGSYDLFTGNAVGLDFNQVGFGRSGTGATGDLLSSGLRRQGNNRFDFTGADPIWGGGWGGHDILFADFDNGLAAQDASCNLGAFFAGPDNVYCDLGLGQNEVMSAGGDSGGPLFVGGQIAAVASFIATIDDEDPFFSGDIDGGILNSSFGEFGGYVPIAAHADWLEQQVVPEPATVVLLLTGLLGVALVRRRLV